MTSSNNTSTAASASYSQLPRNVGSLKRKVEYATSSNAPPAKRTYYGKCQYKTGKCFNERTLKRNGDAHSLCEEHRVKQNLIQRRSDRKYQTVHAIRRRERSQRRAVLKKQVSMAVAQQLFYEHQQQKTLGIPLPHHHPLHVLATNGNSGATSTSDVSRIVGLAPPIRVPQPSSALLRNDQSGSNSPLVLSFQSQSDRTAVINRSISKVVTLNGTNESTPTGIDNFAPDSFLNMSKPLRTNSMPALKDDEIDESNIDNFGYTPIVSFLGDKEMWSDDDIEFLQTILLA
ncbi:unnamed protein product [Peronospora belbahrii]|uniref:Uncharacterized protein n=1 Tax=Peronospora belbahrii TaxID=622444 RepID=A0AAU9KL69_9STRA|nr:unnamed protein product [Peronospora belbahrii]CAH0516811.1 unnamed protein product [Peronospora belbahrii]